MSAVGRLPEVGDSASRVPGSTVRPAPLPLVESRRITRLAAVPTAERVAEFWAEVEDGGLPLVEAGRDADHRVVTFVARAEAGDDEVLLQANRLTDPARPRAVLLRPVPGTDVLALSLEMRADWRATYQFTRHPAGTVPKIGPVTPGDLRRQRSTGEQDPWARRQFPARKAMAASSVVELDQAPPQPWRDPRPGVRAGERSEHTLVDANGHEQRLTLLLPATAAAERLLVLLDGDVWGDALPIGPTLDNLHHDGLVPPTAAVLIESADEQQRWADFAASPDFLAFLGDTLLPWVRERIPARATTAEHTTIAGQSLGALGALWAGLSAPEVFGNVVAQSPSLWWRGPGTGPFKVGDRRGTAEWLTEFARGCAPGARLQIEVGTQEWLLLDPARRLRDVLVAGGHDLTHREFNGGHDHACWWGGLADALIDLNRSAPHLEENP